MVGDYGEKVGNFPLTAGESQSIQLEVEEVKDLRAKGKKCLVGRLGVLKRFNKEAFKNLLIRIWRLAGDLFCKEILDNVWVFEFEEDNDRRRVLEGRPWTYDRTILIMDELDGQKAPSQMTFTHTPIWIQVHDMPMDFMSRGIGSKIGASLGNVEEVAVADDDVGWGRYLRIRVVIDLYQPLERGRSLTLNGASSWVHFKYEKLPAFCFKCGRILHASSGCPISSSKRANHKIGVWGWALGFRLEINQKSQKNRKTFRRMAYLSHRWRRRREAMVFSRQTMVNLPRKEIRIWESIQRRKSRRLIWGQIRKS
jgi:hypothetical protein